MRCASSRAYKVIAMKVRNVSNSRIFIGSKVIAPGEEAELTSEEAGMSGVKALLKSGELVRVEEKPKRKK